MPLKEKREEIKRIKKYCKTSYILYHKKYKKYKTIDEVVDFITAILNASSITCILSTPAVPPLFIASAVCSGLQFVITRVQDKMKLKDKYNQYQITSKQYDTLRREIITILHKNHLTNSDCELLIEEFNDKINLIKDTEV